MGIIRRTLEKLRTGLSKTRQKFTSSFRSLLTIGRKIDEELLDDLETALIGADVGVKSTLRIIEDLRQAFSEKRIERCEQILDFLKTEMKSYWPQTDRSLAFAPTGPTVILVAGVNGTLYSLAKNMASSSASPQTIASAPNSICFRIQ